VAAAEHKEDGVEEADELQSGGWVTQEFARGPDVGLSRERCLGEHVQNCKLAPRQGDWVGGPKDN